VNDARISRFMGPIGLLTVIAIFVGFGPLGSGTPGENASGAKVVAYYTSHMAMSWASIYVVGFGLALFLLFVSGLRGTLRQAQGGQTFWPNLVFAAGIVLVAGLVSVGAIQVVLIVAAHNHELAIARTVNFISSNTELPIIFGMAVVTLSTGAAILSNRVAPLPRTLGWYSVLVGVVACLGPVGFLSFLVGFPVWILAVGFVVSARARRTAGGGIAAPVADPTVVGAVTG
jgi:hypothetical protein